MNVEISGVVSLSPFSVATVVVSDNYIETFPHTEKLIAYLQRQFLQLDVEVVVSSARPFTIKGSWTTIIKIDEYLRTLVSRFLVKEFVPTEADFNAAFAHFKEDNSSWDNTVNAKQQNLMPENEVDKNPNHCTLNKLGLNSQRQNEQDLVDRPTSSIPQSNLERDNSVPSTNSAKELIINRKPLDKWYFSGKTVNKIHRRYLSPWKSPPDPYVIVEAERTNKTNQPSIKEIEEVLCQVYNKETIDQYQKKLASNDSEKYNSSQKQCRDKNKSCSVKIEINAPENSKESCEGDYCSKSNLFISAPLPAPLPAPPPNNQTVSHTTNSELTQHNSVKKVMKKKGKNHSHSLQTGNIQSETCIEDGIHEMVNQSQVNERRQSLRQKVKKSTLLSEITASDNKVINTKKDFNEKKDKKNKKLKRTFRSTSRKQMRKRSNMSESVSHKEQAGSSKNLLATSLTNIKKQENPRLIKLESAEIMDEIQSKQITDNMFKQNVTSNLVYKCDNCGYETSTRRKLSGHQRRVHLIKTFTCEICSKDFGYSKDLRRHRKCHAKAENCCDVCGRLYKDVRKLEEHKRVHTENYVKPEFACKFCSKSFSTKYVLAYHIKSDHLGVKRTYICPTCGKLFSQKSSYLQHANVHLGIRPYVCEECGKQFAYGKSLKEHVLLHKKEKLFSCEICRKFFRQGSGLKIHMKIHKSTKDHVCAICGKGFSQRQALVRHERIHFGEKPFECLLCKRAFADSSVLRRHLILIHKKDPKQWQEHTVCHTRKRTDYFISILNDSSDAKTSELSNAVSQQTVNELTNGLTEKGPHSNLPLPELTERGQHLFVSDQDNQLSDLQRDVEEHYVTVSKHRDTDIGVKVKVEPVNSNIPESSALTEHFDSLVEHPNIQPQALETESQLPSNNHISQLDPSVHPSPQSILASQKDHVPTLTTQPIDTAEELLSNDSCSHSSNTTFSPMEFFPETE